MKNIKSQCLSRSLIFVLSVFSLSVSAAFAQIGQLGIYGSVPPAKRADTRYVHVEPNDTDGPTGYTIPVNGNKNFNFYYLQDGSGFLPGEHYTVSYLDASLTSLGSEVVNYTPNSGHTNGTQVANGFNGSSDTRGLHGVVYGRIQGVNYPLPNAAVQVVEDLMPNTFYVRTNGAGYFDAYYQNGYTAEFLPVDVSVTYERYDLSILGSLNGCSFSAYFPLRAQWAPDNYTNPSLSSYFVLGAETDVGDLILNANNCASD